ncbi:hypothetical protein L2E82_15481 [Cichorium intybus]|uniref:Uncharacterized protein n=1 Tax=Cichorium intybus TaxID=13427 RepID=A0ACB9F3G8_CICIN|nr:hypothetical protein L2E82_15481 [Cichorium intybus]
MGSVVIFRLFVSRCFSHPHRFILSLSQNRQSFTRVRFQCVADLRRRFASHKPTIPGTSTEEQFDNQTPERDAFLANEATKKGVKSNQALAEIPCTRSSIVLLFVKKAYQQFNLKSMEEDVPSSTSEPEATLDDIFSWLLDVFVNGFR